MRYLLDSDTLIRSKNDSYPFEVVPKFWTWLSTANHNKQVYSIDNIRAELLAENDQLSRWAKLHSQEFFLPIDSLTNSSLKEISTWVHSNQQYTNAAKQKFFASADYVLVSYAHAHGDAVVTFEVDEPNSKTSVKIPTVCNKFGVKSLNIFQLLRVLKATL
jgi:hypothetical protein